MLVGEIFDKKFKINLIKKKKRDGKLMINNVMLDLKECYEYYDNNQNYIIYDKLFGNKYEIKNLSDDDLEEYDDMEKESDDENDLGDALQCITHVLIDGNDIYKYMFLKEVKDNRNFWILENEDDIGRIPVGKFFRLKSKYYYRYDDNNIQDYFNYKKEEEEECLKIKNKLKDVEVVLSEIDKIEKEVEKEVLICNDNSDNWRKEEVSKMMNNFRERLIMNINRCKNLIKKKINNWIDIKKMKLRSKI